MDYEHLRQTLTSHPSATAQQVTVNQRHLIDKILARYSAEFTIYREMLQNANDAGATCIEIHFVTNAGSGKHQADTRLLSITCRNNGRAFTADDWKRLKSIAEGNPDEQKIGFFGVGFYSLFSICEEPMVISGGQCLSFHWKEDQLFTRQAVLEELEGSNMWTSVYLRLRSADVSVPDMDSFAHFIAKSLLFTRSLSKVEVNVNSALMFCMDRKCSPNCDLPALPSNDQFQVTHVHSNTLQLTLDKRYSSEPQSKGFFGDLWRVTREALDGGSLEQVRKPGTFSLFARVFRASVKVSLPPKVLSEMERITKKKPAKQVEIAGLYSSHGEQTASDLKHKHPVLKGILPSESGRVYIGFETHQTTGLGVHFSAPFIPTVERESIDFVDSAVRVWNEGLTATLGVLGRVIWEQEVSSLNVNSGTYVLQVEHLLKGFGFNSQTAPIAAIGKIIEDHFIRIPGFRVPSTIGTVPVSDLRIIPKDMRIFLIDTPQVLIEFELLRRFGVKEAGWKDLVNELKKREFTDEQTIAALNWGLLKGVDPMVYDLLLVPVGDGSVKKPYSHIRWYLPRTAHLNWVLPEDCLAKTFQVQSNLKKIPLLVLTKHRLSHVKHEPKSYEELLTVLSNLDYFGLDYVESEDYDSVVQYLKTLECIPSTSGIKKPEYVFLEDVAAFGVSIPVLQLRNRKMISDSLLKRLGVRTHLPADELLQTIESLEWDPLKLLSYLDTIQDDLSDSEVLRIKNSLKFYGFSGTADKFRVDQLYRDSAVARLLKLPVFTLADSHSGQYDKLLKKLSFNFFVNVEVLLASALESVAFAKIIYLYLSDNWGYYKDRIPDEVHILCDKPCNVSACFVDSRCGLLKFPVVQQELAEYATRLFHVRKRPHSSELIGALKQPSNFTPSLELYTFLADCDFDNLASLSTVPFLASDGRLVSPSEAFFRVPPEFESIFTSIDTKHIPPGSRAAGWVRSCGVGEEPNASQLMSAVTRSSDVFLTMGPKKYASLLRLFAVNIDLVDTKVLQQFKQSSCLLGQVNNQEVSLYTFNSVYIGDDSNSQRLFNIPIVPSPDLEPFYEQLGCKRVTFVVQQEWYSEGLRSVYTGEWSNTVKNRSGLIVREGLVGRLKDPDLAHARVQSISFISVPKLYITKTFGSLKSTINTTACYSLKEHCILVCNTCQIDSFDVAGCVGECVFNGTMSLSDRLLINTFLTMSLEALRARGFILSGDKESEEDVYKGITVKPPRPHAISSGVHEESSAITKSPATNPVSRPPVLREPPPTQPPQVPRKPKRNIFEKMLGGILGPLTSTTKSAPQSMDDILRQGVSVSKPNHGKTVSNTSGSSNPPLPDNGNFVQECSVPSDLYLKGSIDEFEFYTSSAALAVPPQAHLLSSCLGVLSEVFSVNKTSLHIFHDPHSKSIAFNKGGSLFFNAHYCPLDPPKALIFWYMTGCHELAHNFCSGHDERHEHYMMSYAEHYLVKLMPFL